MHIWYWITSVTGQYANFMPDNNIIVPIYSLIHTNLEALVAHLPVPSLENPSHFKDSIVSLQCISHSLSA